jgi:glycosyltransferase involved in cell wall biosynthesis
MDISVVIPAYNEEERIENSVNRIREFLINKDGVSDFEIIVIDDGSKDRTREVVYKLMESESRIRINNKRGNKGKGYSVREGILMSRYGLVLFSDADLATPIEELNVFLNEINYFDIVIASRNLKESRVERSFFRDLVGKGFALSGRVLLGLKYRDTQCGFKLFKRDVALRLFSLQKMDGFAFDAEILYLAKKFGYSVKEVGVTWRDQKGSKVNIAKDSFKMLRDLVKIRINELNGRYNG